jgi:hypothetical protein
MRSERAGEECASSSFNFGYRWWYNVQMRGGSSDSN